jgi:probable rRNA maturation factor
MPKPNEQIQSAEPEPEPIRCGWLTIDIVHDAGDWSALGDVAGAIEAAVNALTDHRSLKPHESADVCIALSDDVAVRRLNARYRGKDKPTNVLSFPAGDDAQEPDSGSVFLGDVVLALETVQREAAELGIPPLHHIQHLAVHGVLHLNNYDHETDEDAAVMEGLEIEILATLGIASPYSHATALERAVGE